MIATRVRDERGREARDDHGVERGGDAEEVADGVAVFEVVEVLVEVEAVAGFGVFEEAGDAVVGVGLFIGGDDDFDAVAGGEDGGFGLLAHGLTQTAQHRPHVVGGKGKTTPQIEGCGGVVETERPNSHGANYKI